MHASFVLVLLSALAISSTSAGHSKPKRLNTRTSPCFIVGAATLPAEVQTGIPALSAAVKCDSSISPGIPNLVSGGVSLATIDFQKSTKSPLGFAEDTFPIQNNPSRIGSAAAATLQDQLNVYLAWEAAVRSQSAANSALLANVKSVKFFLGFQQARINAARGVAVGAAGTPEHQLGKVLKNAPGATQAEKDAANALASSTS